MKTNKDSLGDRMKGYENKHNLTYNIPIILRIDGRAFHTFTRGMNKPYDLNFIVMMDNIGKELCKEIQGCRIAYLQSDEISFLLFNNPESDAWFDNELQKMCSVSASLASSTATKLISTLFPSKVNTNISFDARAFIIPESDVVNYFIWRQKDWERNSLQMFTRHYYSQKEMNGKKKEDMHNMLHEKNLNWNDLDAYLKRGRCIVKNEETFFVNENEHYKNSSGVVIRNRWKVDYHIPIFTEDREYISKRLK